MNKNTGGHEFPDFLHDGMTLRDYFAAKAMQGISATLTQTDGEPFWNLIATDSYKMADAMLKAREE